MYICIYILGVLALALRVNRWVASCEADRGGHAGKLEQHHARGTGNVRAFFRSPARKQSVVRVYRAVWLDRSPHMSFATNVDRYEECGARCGANSRWHAVASTCFGYAKKRTSGRTSERANEREHEPTNERSKDPTHAPTNERRNDQTNDRTYER